MGQDQGAYGVAAGYEDFDVAATAVNLTVPNKGTTKAEFKVQGGDVRCRTDGGTAVAGNGGGQLLEVGEVWRITGTDHINGASFIRNGSVSAVLDVSYS